MINNPNPSSLGWVESAMAPVLRGYWSVIRNVDMCNCYYILHTFARILHRTAYHRCQCNSNKKEELEPSV